MAPAGAIFGWQTTELGDVGATTREEIARLLLCGDVRGAVAPAVQRQIQNAKHSVMVKALMRSMERPRNPY